MNVVELAGAIIPGIKEIVGIYVKPDNPKILELNKNIQQVAQSIALYAMKLKEATSPETKELYELAVSRAQMLEMRVKLITGEDKNIKVRDTIIASIKLIVALAMMIK